MWRDSYPSNDERSSYKCARAASKNRGDCTVGEIKAQKVEETVSGAFLGLLTGPVQDVSEGTPIAALFASDEAEIALFGDGPQERPLQALEDKQALLQRRIDNLVVQLADAPNRTAKAIRRQLDAYSEELEEVDREKATLEAETTLERVGDEELAELLADGYLLARWKSLDVEGRNALLRLAIERVEVLPKPGKGKPVEIVWHRRIVNALPIGDELAKSRAPLTSAMSSTI
jgi:hypothetical protein